MYRGEEGVASGPPKIFATPSGCGTLFYLSMYLFLGLITGKLAMRRD
jgi:hypothetical protein